MPLYVINDRIVRYNSINEITPIFENAIVGIMNGCYCPPHKGHFNSWEYACQEFKLSILCITSVNVDKKHRARHMIPYEFTQKIILEWGKELYRKYNTTVMFTDINEISTFWNIPSNVQKLYDINVHETNNDDEMREIKEQLIAKHKADGDDFLEGTTTVRRYMTHFKTLKADLLKAGKIYDKTEYRNMFRDLNGPSATKFTKCIVKNRNESIDSKKCFEFLPDFLSDESKIAYFKEIYTKYINDSMYEKCLAEGIDADECVLYRFDQVAGKKYKRKTNKRKTNKRKTNKRKTNKRKTNKRKTNK